MKMFIKIRISGDKLELEKISKQLKVSPICTYKKGDLITNTKIKVNVETYQEDCWMYGIESKDTELQGDFLQRFVKELVPHSEFLKSIAIGNDITIWISIYPDNEQCNINIPTFVIDFISKIGATLDINTLFLKNFYDGIY